MNAVIEIQELTSVEDWREAFPVMHELRQNLDELNYLQLLERMTPEGYRLFALRDSTVIVALAGIGIHTNFYDDRHVWVYDLVTASYARSKGYGQRLLEFIEELGRQENCKLVALSSGLQRMDAHRFYEQRMGYTKSSYSFRKPLI
jgi:GNAT superfamily N-acetyltransferase